MWAMLCLNKISVAGFKMAVLFNIFCVHYELMFISYKNVLNSLTFSLGSRLPARTQLQISNGNSVCAAFLKLDV